MAVYLLDTDVLSELMAVSTRQRRRKIVGWLQSLGDNSVILSSVSISEVTRGIALLEARNPSAAEALEHALDRIVSAYDDAIITPSHVEWQRFARLSALPELRHLCRGRNEKDQPRTGADLFLAVQAGTIGAAVATLNARDFVAIDRHMPLGGGIIDPVSANWTRQPDPI